jgi:hypothetical protein
MRVPCSLIGQLCVAHSWCVITVITVASCTSNVSVVGFGRELTQHLSINHFYNQR